MTNSWQLENIIKQLEELSSPENLSGMARFGITTDHALGVAVPHLRKLAQGIRSHALALQLWETGIHEARILASLVDNPTEVTEAQMEAWVVDFDSWDVCDQVCSNLFDRTPFTVQKALAWSKRDEEYVKRAGFVLMAELAMHDKKAADEVFMQFFPVIEHEATDPRNFVRKAVNWALRGIGKRNATLRKEAIATGQKILLLDSRAAKWIARDALRELERYTKRAKTV